MTSTSIESRGPRSSDWAKMKPHIAELYKLQQLPLKSVMKELEEKYGFIAKEADYRTKIRNWGVADASWKKNGSSETSEAIATTILRYARSGHKIEIYRWGELLPKREVLRIRNQNHVPLLKLLNPIPPDLPKGYIIRPQLKDRVEELTNGLPSLTLERSIYERFTTICPMPLLSNTGMFELRDYIRVQRGLPLLQVQNKELYERLMSGKSALRSVLPHIEGQMRDIGSDSTPSMRTGVYMSDLHRHLLCTLGNNLAGLGNISGQQLYHLLRIVSDEHVIMKLLSGKSHLRLPIAQQLLRACVEVGNASMANGILSMSVLQVGINELVCEVDGQPYTALERASMLRNKAMIDVLLHHGADIHKTFGCGCVDKSGALNCALLGDHNDHRLDPQIFNTLLQRTDRIEFRTLEILMRQNEDDYLIDVLQKLGHTNQDDWQVAKGTKCIWETFLLSIKQESKATKVLKIMEDVGVTKTTRMLNVTARNGHQNVVTKLLHEDLSLNEISLCSAIWGENEELVRLFLKKGATVNDYTTDHREIYTECEHHDWKSDWGLHVSFPNDEVSYWDYADPYSEAIRTENEDVVQILVEYHALERLDQWLPWLAAWKAAVSARSRGILAMLLSKRQQIPAHHLGYGLSKIASLGDYDMATELLNRGAELDAVSNELGYLTQPPLIEALKADKSDIANLFLESGANPDIYYNGVSAIELAVKKGDHTIVEKLLVAGALRDQASGDSAFQEAVTKKDFRMMDKLWDAGAFSDEALQIATAY